MCNLALPERLRTWDAWKHHDNDRWYSRWYQKLMIKYGVFGPRDPHKQHQWREWPITLFALRGDGHFRAEDDELAYGLDTGRVLLCWLPDGQYLSRCQMMSRWSVQLQWPLFFAAHVYIKGKPLFFYVGAHRDSDKVYWFPSAFIGLNWK